MGALFVRLLDEDATQERRTGVSALPSGIIRYLTARKRTQTEPPTLIFLPVKVSLPVS